MRARGALLNPGSTFYMSNCGGDLLSHTLSSAVPSALAGLASGFGMGPGVSLQLLTTDKHTKQKYPLGCPFAWVLCQILHSGRGHDSDCFFFSCFAYTRSVLVFVVVN